ncbi:hydroxymethylglutaryl-CoA lyase [Chromobacterium subtsugae]|uniref:hydroxymethylglutaryl-CoA lyase n=1 Tax=Chromobacterium subtsugae TaxID=251747 RepID=A0ABS7FH61_9NEIS|nr:MULTISPECIES: hydroxymethylglutaryl-CoA lyase [Chromobacterium]KUM01691.1 hydroxymethylglutaryl-CoA lyase [Chromobacterium subtsugae]KZE84592.1 hydroxymethylglutaryl-CoA lyase [Chromobacterium sp. F49]MBW7568205.1 hydroxymethylglutaryl-CoA lyase [Chromobacterium subtsugae]MBW8289316.1 hydroxymethylglutaryl-CoA lyase [Chromobacterium subtsugae]OBU87539.1 hydroxymethylglutaryl-CoA lyase [Chromobacterium subtsugae]
MQHVKIVEVGPRDGLQNEKQLVPLAVKLELIRRLADAGLSAIEAGAFVSPKWVPQMADSAEVLKALDLGGAVAYPVLVPNDQGLDAALEAGAREIAVFGAASESFSRKNINASIAESLQRFESVMRRAQAEKLRVRGYVSCVVGCPYEGPIAPAKVAEVTQTLLDMGCYEVSLGDTIGVGTPASVHQMLDAVLKTAPAARLAGHFHDTYGMAIANIREALNAGIRVFDASVAGLGGCPYAKGASGNVASEDVAYLLRGEGYHTGIDLTKLVAAAWHVSDALGKPPASKLAHALGRQA